MSKNLLVGVAKQDITPQIGCQLYGYAPDVFSESIHDRLSLTAFAFISGDLKALMISACVCLIKTELADELRKEISKKLDIPFDNIIISATHTHSGPNIAGAPGWGDVDFNYYNTIFKPAIISASENAFLSAEPATVGIASGNSYIGINRRELNLENNVLLGQCPWGSFNPKMTVISFKGKDKTIGNIITYGCHGTCAGWEPIISRDWSGGMTDALESLTGAITAFFNGPEGDVGPRLSNGMTTGVVEHIHEIADIASEDAINIYNSITSFDDVSIDISSMDLKVALSPRISYDEAVKSYKESDKKVKNFTGQKAVYFEKVIYSYKNGYIEKEYKEIPQVVFRIGNIVFATFPYELFSEIGMRIDKAFTDLDIVSLSNTNGSEGYFPTEDQICRGGYEIIVFKHNDTQAYADNADFYLVKETLKNIENLKRRD